MAGDSPYENQLREAKRLHSEGIEGNKRAVVAAYEKLAELRKSYPNHALIEAYYGSSLALMARDASSLLVKEEKAREGLDALNRAVELNPNDKEIRLLRGNVSLRLPDTFFQTARTAVEDFSFLLARQQADPRYLTPKQTKDVINHLITAYETIGRQDKVKEMKKLLSKRK
ncbi:hypothetical protein D3P08_06695 [Paenibacillus nanensis]|uniref:Tetratricopeptide repeat protein n=1 Tax=Paenibacillus nanensis TaxID=393251 RepID=A0A3A1UZC5_9BACL|nr:hypothetical protein [Paenibacillus nanensis]RIX53939.1 hypothetical protein D3P08_06695 [Paenibacillus nanensis]